MKPAVANALRELLQVLADDGLMLESVRVGSWVSYTNADDLRPVLHPSRIDLHMVGTCSFTVELKGDNA